MSLIPGIYLIIQILQNTRIFPPGHVPGLDRASTGPRLGPDWASCKSRWEGHGKINIIQKTHKLAGYQDRRSKVRDTSSKDVISEDMSPKA